MPLINGMKMACEPCIRGHRSTKCTHANERLMVPVRKPGRPLSACPHPRDSPCGCGSVTAAIPRKQTCHCGTGTPTHSDSRPPTSSSSSDAPSPTRVTFKVSNKVSKPSKMSSSRKQSFDPANFERMDINQINVLPFDQRLTNVPTPLTNGYAILNPPQLYGFPPQYPNFQVQFSHVPMQLPAHHNRVDHAVSQNVTNGYDNGIHANRSLEHVIESQLATPTGYENGDFGKYANGTSATPTPKPNGSSNPTLNGSSCCGPKQKSHSHTPNTGSISSPPAPEVSSCCSPKKSVKSEVTSNGNSAQSNPQLSQQILPHNGMPFGQPMYHLYPQPTVFTYPATYGSFQNPLQPQEWQQNFRANNSGQPPVSLPSGPSAFNAPPISEAIDTVHTCSCGDACQCIGCAAHPYNDATRDYVRSAWASMSLEQSPSEIYTNGQTPTDENNSITTKTQPMETPSSPITHTPSSTTSGNGEEQSLSAADFFFVNYPFTADGCGGDTQSCPCGDDCQCLGCTIHRQPPVSCCGEKETCGCGDDCTCVGCEFHGNT